MFRGEMIQAGNGSAAEGLAEELHLLPVDILHHHYLHFVEEVNCEIGQGVAKDRLLNEKNVATSLLDLLHDVEDVGPLLLQYSVHGSVIGNDNLHNIIIVISYNYIFIIITVENFNLKNQIRFK